MTQELLENISSNDLKNLVSKYSANKIFLVTGKNSYFHSGSDKFISEALEGMEYVRFSEFDQNPRYEDAMRGLDLFLQSKFDLIIAIGGGSVMDMAKLINIFSANNHIAGLKIVKDSKLVAKKGVPLIAIPTTSGTGSEATHFAVVYHNKKKYSVAHKFILPNVVVLNYMFTKTQNKYLTACAGLDALSQAIESYWSVGATDESKVYAKEAIQLLLANLEKVTLRTSDEKGREAVMMGAYLAGKAINISKTTAAHAVSYAFTTYYSIPHGHAVFLTLPEFFEYNYLVSENDLNDPRGVEYVQKNIENICAIFGVKSATEGKHFLTNFAKSIGVELSFKKLGIKNYEEIVVSNVNLERLGNNPAKVDKNALHNLLRNKAN